MKAKVVGVENARKRKRKTPLASGSKAARQSLKWMRQNFASVHAITLYLSESRRARTAVCPAVRVNRFVASIHSASINIG
jgi:hypothetical protein